MKGIAAVVVSLALFAAGEGAAETPSCKVSPIVTQPCFTVRARLFFAADTPPTRLWPVGTRRLLGVGGLEGDSETERPLPKNVRSFMTRTKDDDLRPLMGTFRVCPLERSRPGWMLHVCIQSADHLALDVSRVPHR
jgi:hypothetical protein